MSQDIGKLSGAAEQGKENMWIDLKYVGDPGVRQHSETGHLFRTYNFIASKEPGNTFSLGDYGQVCAHAFSHPYPGTFPWDQITISLFQSGEPVALIRDLRKLGMQVSRYADGVSYVTGERVPFPTQIIAMSALSDEHAAFRILSGAALEKDFVNMLHMLESEKNPEQRKSICNVLVAGMGWNRALFLSLREGNPDLFLRIQTLFPEETALIEDEEGERKRAGPPGHR